jgi:galactokinase
MASVFYDVFGFAPQASADAPGRVNLLGEHTDYNDGFVLPTAIPQRTYIELAHSPNQEYQLYAVRLDEYVTHVPDQEMPAGFSSYVFGCIRLLQQRGFPITPVTMTISSEVPIGAGLSSSAALEVAVLRGLRKLFELNLDDVEIAQIAQQAEIQFAHVHCGIMDQMASSLADVGHMLFLDTRTLERKVLPLPRDTELIVIDSGIPRALANSEYNLRRSECEQAAALLGVPALRDVNDLRRTETLPPPLNQRARHVISENQRVLEAVGAISVERFGALMNASHASLRNDYAVSIPALDVLVDLLQQHEAVYGARLTGAGFGGACVALAKKNTRSAVTLDVLAAYTAAGHHGKILV